MEKLKTAFNHIRSTALLNMAIKCGVVVLFFIISLWWLPAAYISGVLLALFILAEFDVRSIYYILFFHAFENVMLVFYFTAFGLFAVISLTKSFRKTPLLFVITSAVFVLYCLAFTIPRFGYMLPMFFAGILLVLVCLTSNKEINFKAALYWFIAGILGASIIGLLINFIPGAILFTYLPFGRELWEHRSFGLQRFAALSNNTNHLHAMTSAALAGLLVLDLQKKIRLREFIPLFAIMFAISFATIARTFMITFAVMMTAYLVLKIIRHKRQSLKTFAFLGLALIVVCGAMYHYTLANMMRLNIIPERQIIQNNRPLRQETFEIEYRPDIDDPGRGGIWRRNLRDWSSSAYTVFFGRGIDSPNIGNVTQHNTLVFILVKTGLVGLILFIAFFFSLFYTMYKVKKFKFDTSLLIIFLTLACLAMTESIYPRVMFFIFIAFFILSTEQKEEIEIETTDTKNIEQ